MQICNGADSGSVFFTNWVGSWIWVMSRIQIWVWVQLWCCHRYGFGLGFNLYYGLGRIQNPLTLPGPRGWGLFALPPLASLTSPQPLFSLLEAGMPWLCPPRLLETTDWIGLWICCFAWVWIRFWIIFFVSNPNPWIQIRQPLLQTSPYLLCKWSNSAVSWTKKI